MHVPRRLRRAPRVAKTDRLSGANVYEIRTSFSQLTVILLQMLVTMGRGHLGRQAYYTS